jgi:hypothetical protein
MTTASLIRAVASLTDAELDRLLSTLSPGELEELRELANAEYAERSDNASVEEIEAAARILAQENGGTDN